MSKVPSTTKNPVRFRGPTNSEDYNALQEDVFYDIVELYNMAGKLEEELVTANNTLFITSRFQQMRIASLELQMKQLKDELAAAVEQTGNHVAYAFAHTMKVDALANNSEKAFIDKVHGVVHLPVAGKTISKMYIYDEATDDIVLPSSLSVQAFPQDVGILNSTWRIEENDPINAVDGNPNTYWHRRVMMPLEYPPDQPVSCQLTVQLPDTIISNQNANLITIHPFPINSLTIEKIEYSLNGDYNLLPGWPLDDNSNPIPYENVGNMKFCIPDTPMSSLRVTLIQPNVIEENYRLTYHMGIQDLSVMYTNHQSQVGKFDIEVEVPAGTALRQITSLTPKFANEALLSDTTAGKPKLFSYHVYSLDSGGKTEYLRDQFPIIVSTEKVLIKATVHYDSQSKVTPALEYIELTYQDV